MTVRHLAKSRLEPWTSDRPEPLELLGRLAGSTSFRRPGSRGRPAVTTEDIAHALGCVQSRRGQVIALAVATGNAKLWPEVHKLAYPKLVAELLADKRTRVLVSGSNKFRVRLVLYDAFHDLIAWRQASWREAAKRSRMQQSTYRELHAAITGFIRTEAVQAAQSAVARLFRE